MFALAIVVSVALVHAQECESQQPPNSQNKLLHGIQVALVSPFDQAGKLNREAVEPLVRHFLSAGIQGFYLCGSTGEGFAMTVEERKIMTEEVVRHVAGAVPVTVHVGACPLEDAVELAKHAKEVGADAVSSVAPGTYKWLNTDGKTYSVGDMIEYFKAVGAASDLPFYAYWLGDAIQSSPKDFLTLMEEVPHFKGMKYTAGNMYVFEQIKSLSDAREQPLNLLTGSDEINIAGAVMGSDGAIGSTYNVMPRMFIRLRQAFDEGRIADAMKLQQQVNVVISIMLEHAHCKDRGTNIINAHKAVLRSRGLDVGFPRKASVTRGHWSPEQSDAFVSALNELSFTVE